MPADEDVNRVFDEFWRDIIMPAGEVDLDALKRELFDYHALLERVPKVYDHVTGGFLTNPHHRAGDVIAYADAHYLRMYT